MILVADLDGERLDAFLARSVENLSRSGAQKLIEEGCVLLSGKPGKKNDRLTAGQKISVTIPEPKEIDIAPREMKLDIVYEDDDLLVINKPKGLVVHPAAGHQDDTLVNGLMFALGDQLSGINGELRPGIVHRIDKDTSGLLVVAKNDYAKMFLSRQFFEKTTDRLYQALVWGRPDPKDGTVDTYIGRNPKDRLQMAVYTADQEGGKHAVTHYKTLATYNYVSLVECKLETGRTHQIRVHMKHKGCPLFNDERYGGDQILKGIPSSSYKQFIKKCFEICPRQALHAKTLGFEHPRTHERMFFNSELPEDFASLLKKWEEIV